MPEIGRIQSTNFQALLTELGITRNNIPFALRSEVSPVVLVGGTVSFVAAATPTYRVTDIFTAGTQTNPAAGTVLADTGQLPAGGYTLQFVIEAAEANAFDIQWRNAANSANLAAIRVRFPLEVLNLVWQTRFQIDNADERIRVINVGIGAAQYNATILART